MAPARLLPALALAAWAGLCAPPLRAEDEAHPPKRPERPEVPRAEMPQPAAAAASTQARSSLPAPPPFRPALPPVAPPRPEPAPPRAMANPSFPAAFPPPAPERADEPAPATPRWQRAPPSGPIAPDAGPIAPDATGYAPVPSSASDAAPDSTADAPAAPGGAAVLPYEVHSLYGPAQVAAGGAAGGSGDAAFQAMPAWLQAHALAFYGGAGLDYVVAQYPASTDNNVAWQLFGGARTRYLGAELDLHTMGYYHATINNQGVEVGTDMVSLSLLGFLPLADDTDFYVRYGRTAWSVNATGPGNTPSTLTSGTNGTAGIGFEFREGRLLMRMEARKFWRVYQSDDYLSFGVSVGAYFD